MDLGWELLRRLLNIRTTENCWLFIKCPDNYIRVNLIMPLQYVDHPMFQSYFVHWYQYLSLIMWAILVQVFTTDHVSYTGTSIYHWSCELANINDHCLYAVKDRRETKYLSQRCFESFMNFIITRKSLAINNICDQA